MSSSTNLRTEPAMQYFWGMKKEKSHNLLGIAFVVKGINPPNLRQESFVKNQATHV